MLFRRTETRRSGIFNFERNFIMNKTTFAAITLVLGSLLAGQAFATDAATDAKAADKQAVAAKAADRKSTDAYADLDKIKKW
jgi:hypothetical protein